MSAVAARKAASEHRYLSPEQVSELLPGVTPTKLARWRDDGHGPAYRKAGRTVIYAEADVRAWIESSRIATRDQP